jgi:hypothetical protein
MIDELAGVDAAIDKQVTQMMKTGLFEKEEARAIVLAQRKARGEELPPELDIDSDEDEEEEEEAAS